MKRVPIKTPSSNCFHFVVNLILIVFLSTCTFSCSKHLFAGSSKPLVTTNGISEEIKDLIYFKGNEDAPVVLINAQSGPDTKFSKNEVNLISKNFNTTDILTINVHQVQTLNPSILDNSDITLDEAVNFNAKSIETLSQVINYFKNKGKTVYVLGISFGAFIVQELIAKKGIDTADKYLIIAGRLDINDVIWQGLSEGRYGLFENGVHPVVDSSPVKNVTERNIARIASGLGMNRYTQLFNTIDDLSKVTYIYGTTDQVVGNLTNREVQFLESKNANLIAGNGGHDEIINNFFKQGLSEAFGVKNANAQEIKFGTKSGLNFAFITGDNTEGLDPITDFYFGLQAEIPISEKFSFQSELLYSGQGSEVNLNYLNIPLLGKYYLTKVLSLEVGPQIGFLLSVKNGEKDSFKTVDFGVDFGLGYKLDNGLNFSARYNLGLSDINNIDGISGKNRNAVFQLSVGYFFF